MAIVVFLALGALIAVAGAKLVVLGDAIAAHARWSRLWMGAVLLAVVTSLPELATGLSASAVARLPDIAVGDVLGSCVFNLALIGLVDALHRGESIFTRVGLSHVLAGALGVLLLSVVVIVQMLSSRDLPWISPALVVYAPLLVAVYLISTRALFEHQRRDASATESPAASSDGGAWPRPLVLFAGWALVVVAAGSALPYAAAAVSKMTGLGDSFVGSLFVACATSLPEAAVVVAAVRLGQGDAALGALFGSNLFNMVVLAIDDVAYGPGRLLRDAEPVHSITAVTAIAMTSLAIIAVLMRPRARVFGIVGWISLLLAGLYLLHAFVLALS